jgi:hypothetical protein
MKCNVSNILMGGTAVLFVLLALPILYTTYGCYMHAYVHQPYEVDNCTVTAYNMTGDELCSINAYEQCSNGSYTYYLGTLHCSNTYTIAVLEQSYPLHSTVHRAHFPSHPTAYYTLDYAEYLTIKWEQNLAPVLSMVVGVEVCVLCAFFVQVGCRGMGGEEKCKCCCKRKKRRDGRVIEYH